MKTPAAVSSRGAVRSSQRPPSVARSIWSKRSEPDRRASARNAKNSAGSVSHANPTSRAAPMPSNGEPVSRAAAAVKKRPSARR